MLQLAGLRAAGWVVGFDRLLLSLVSVVHFIARHLLWQGQALLPGGQDGWVYQYIYDSESGV